MHFDKYQKRYDSSALYVYPTLLREKGAFYNMIYGSGVHCGDALELNILTVLEP